MGLRTLLGVKSKRPGRGVAKKESAAYLASFGFRPATVIDVGVAAKGTPALYEAFPDARFMLIDPLPEASAAAERLRSAGRRAEFVQMAAGTSRASATINRHRQDSKSSLLQWTEPKAGGSVTQVEVAVCPLDELTPDLPGPIGLKIDTEGFELEVLRGARDTLRRTEFVVVECSVQRRFHGGAEFHEVVAFLADAGFRMVDILDLPPMGRPRHIDALFVEKNSMLLGGNERP